MDRLSLGGALSFWLDYRVNGRREAMNFGRYGHDCIGLARVRGRILMPGAGAWRAIVVDR